MLVNHVLWAVESWSSSTFSACPSYISGVHLGFSEIFAYVTIFNPTIEVVAFRLRGWCMLVVFLLPAFFRVRAMECMFAQTRPRFILSLWGMETEPMLTPEDKSPLPEKNSPQRRIEPSTLHQAGQRAQHTINELFRPRESWSEV